MSSVRATNGFIPFVTFVFLTAMFSPQQALLATSQQSRSNVPPGFLTSVSDCLPARFSFCCHVWASDTQKISSSLWVSWFCNLVVLWLWFWTTFWVAVTKPCCPESRIFNELLLMGSCLPWNRDLVIRKRLWCLLLTVSLWRTEMMELLSWITTESNPMFA